MTSAQDDFFVGYLATPSGLRGPLRRIALLLILLALAVNVAAHQLARDPGAALWDLSEPREWTGVVRLTPYPVLERDDGTSLLVHEGKLGALDVATPFASQRVTVRGHAVTRGHELMIELLSEDDAIRLGEILDSKCHLGAMRPGSGKTHKACATLCIDGGIPPLLITIRPDGSPRYLLLVAPDGGVANTLVRGLVGEPVRVRGRVSRSGHLELLRLDTGGVERLTAR
ncbi:MAG: hypothetical protein DRQ55_16760 [Planctomycetota bacterium]|nr:MAG: hypothetical protein DRQ55_16760 [Planctomycetota bacterium]